MICESIKSLLGDELAGKVSEVLKGKGKDGKDLDLVVGNDGTYVPADKYEGMRGQSESAEKTMKAVAAALKDLGGSGDPAKLAEDVKKAQDTIDTLKTEHQGEIERLQKSTALRMGLAGRVYDPEDVIARLDLSTVELDGGGNLKTDLEGLLKPIQESKPYLFKPTKDPAPDLKGAHPAQPGVPPKEGEKAGPTIF